MPQARVNSVTLSYEVAGKGPPVALVHGYSINRHFWDAIVPPLSGQLTIIRYDVRGHGDSEVPSTGYTRAIFVEDLRQLLLHLGYQQASVVGHSMGGGIALEFALTHPQMVQKLALVGTSLGGYTMAPDFNALQGRLSEDARSGASPSTLNEAWLTAPVFDVVRRDTAKLRQIKQILATFTWRDRLDPARLAAVAENQRGRLGQVKAPTLVVVGQDDFADFLTIADIVEAGIPGAKKVLLPAAGHFPAVEQPHALAYTLLGFLAR